MRKKKSNFLITGGAGFIGSEFVRQAARKNYKINVVDNLTYAGDLQRLKEVRGRFKFYKADICDKNRISAIFKETRPDIVVHFAAETHVDRSILYAGAVIKTNILGTQVLIEAARRSKIKKFIHISTDEVYGDIIKGRFSEETPLNPSSPYSSGKAGADLLIKAYSRTYGFPSIIVRPSNNYGPWQYPEKLIPVVIYKALNDQKIPVYGKGMNVREWLYVADCACAILEIIEKGGIGEIYNLSSGEEKKNIEVVERVLDILNKPNSLIQYVKDRPGHDIRYALDSSKLKKEMDWKPEVNFEQGIRNTVQAYKDNMEWLEKKVITVRNFWGKVYKNSNES